MKRFFNLLVLTVGFAFFTVVNAWAVNSVYVESKCVSPNQTNIRVGVWVTNDTPLVAFVLPLEFRDTDGNGSFTSGSCVLDVASGSRLGTSALTGSLNIRTFTGPTPETLCNDVDPPGPSELDQSLCGPPGRSYRETGPVDIVSPDGFAWLGFSTNSLPDLWYLRPGNDSIAGYHVGWPFDGDSTAYDAGASFSFVFNVNGQIGTFEIDTMCSCPRNYLEGTSYRFDGYNYITDVKVPLTFTKGVIAIGPCQNFPPALAFIPQKHLKEGDTLNVLATASDPNGTYPVMTAEPLPPHSSFSDNGDGTGMFTFMPDNNQAGNYDILFIAADDSLADSQTVTVIVDNNASVRSLPTGGNVPTTYSLEQNYPNPFNAGTVVQFAMPHDGRVRLEVFNVLGRKVKTLIDEFRPLGLYAADWDGRDDRGRSLPTGVYIYRIQTDDYSKSRSMLLLK